MVSSCDPLLITSAIAPPSDIFKLHLRDPGMRAIQTAAACLGWATSTKLRQVIICDGTGRQDALMPLVPVLAERGVELELVGFRQDLARVVEYGKGYAEGMVIAHALAHSELLRRTDGFFKVTGRLHISNFDVLCSDVSRAVPTFRLEFGKARQAVATIAQSALATQGPQRRNSRFGKFINPGVSTVFWHCPKRYFDRNLKEAYLSARDRLGWYAELALLPTLLRKGVKGFGSNVEVVGESGTNPRCYPCGCLPDEWLSVARAILGGYE